MRVSIANVGDEKSPGSVCQPVQEATRGTSPLEIREPLGHGKPEQRERIQVYQNKRPTGPGYSGRCKSHRSEQYLNVSTGRVHDVDRPERGVVSIWRGGLDLQLLARIDTRRERSDATFRMASPIDYNDIVLPDHLTLDEQK